MTLSANWLTTAASSPTPALDTRMLLVIRTLTTFGDRAFSAGGHRVWNYPPTDVRQPHLSYSRFIQSLKTLLFGQWD